MDSPLPSEIDALVHISSISCISALLPGRANVEIPQPTHQPLQSNGTSFAISTCCPRFKHYTHIPFLSQLFIVVSLHDFHPHHSHPCHTALSQAPLGDITFVVLPLPFSSRGQSSLSHLHIFQSSGLYWFFMVWAPLP